MAAAGNASTVLEPGVSPGRKQRRHPLVGVEHPSAHHMTAVSLVLQRQRQAPILLHRLGSRRYPTHRRRGGRQHASLEDMVKWTGLVGLVIWNALFQGFSFLCYALSLQRRGLFRTRYLLLCDSYRMRQNFQLFRQLDSLRREECIYWNSPMTGCFAVLYETKQLSSLSPSL